MKKDNLEKNRKKIVNRKSTNWYFSQKIKCKQKTKIQKKNRKKIVDRKLTNGYFSTNIIYIYQYIIY